MSNSQRQLDRVRKFLEEGGIEPCESFHHPILGEYVEHGRVYHLLAVVLKQKPPRWKFIQFIKRHSGNPGANGIEFHFGDQLNTPSQLHIGWKPNVRYEYEHSAYLEQVAIYKNERELAVKAREELLRSPDGKVYIYVQDESSKEVMGEVECGYCQGGILYSYGSVDSWCDKCGGSGTVTGNTYTPKVTNEQAEIASAVRKKMLELADPSPPEKPVEGVNVYVKFDSK